MGIDIDIQCNDCGTRLVHEDDVYCCDCFENAGGEDLKNSVDKLARKIRDNLNKMNTIREETLLTVKELITLVE